MIRGLEDGLDQVSALRFAACNNRGEERSDEQTFSERSEQELVLMPIV